MTQRGECSLITRLGAQLYYPQFGLQNEQYEYFLIGKPKDQKDLYFDELVEDLQTRIGKENAVVIHNDRYRIAGLHGSMPSLGEINLGIMSADANAIAESGFHVICGLQIMATLQIASWNIFQSCRSDKECIRHDVRRKRSIRVQS